jgi:uncharacterized protein (TIGR00369 family)
VSEARNADFERVVRESFARQGLMGHLGARLTRVEAGLVEIELEFREEVDQQHGYFHAGATGAIADSAGGYAALTLQAAGRTVLSVEYKVNLLAPARGERLIATGRVVRSGRTLTVCAIDVDVVEGGRRPLCATMLQTIMGLDASDERPAG